MNHFKLNKNYMVNVKTLTGQIRKDPMQARALTVQEVINRLSKYEGAYLAELIKLNEQFPMPETVERLGSRISPTLGIINACETA